MVGWVGISKLLFFHGKRVGRWITKRDRCQGLYQEPPLAHPQRTNTNMEYITLSLTQTKVILHCPLFFPPSPPHSNKLPVPYTKEILSYGPNREREKKKPRYSTREKSEGDIVELNIEGSSTRQWPSSLKGLYAGICNRQVFVSDMLTSLVF